MTPLLPNFRSGLIFVASVAAVVAGAQAAEPANQLLNGDFSLTHAATGTGGLAILPDNWAGLVGTTDNAGVWGGQLLFSTMGAHNTNHKYYVSQSIDAGTGGTFVLAFDYRLVNPYSGRSINGARVTIDNWYSTVSDPTPTPLFASTYGAAGFDDSWHLGTSLTVTLTAGLHTLYVGTIGASTQNDQASVQYDNVSFAAAVPEPATAALLLGGGLALLGLRRCQRA
jgi:hypothetical protein